MSDMRAPISPDDRKMIDDWLTWVGGHTDPAAPMDDPDGIMGLLSGLVGEDFIEEYGQEELFALGIAWGEALRLKNDGWIWVALPAEGGTTLGLDLSGDPAIDPAKSLVTPGHSWAKRRGMRAAPRPARDGGPTDVRGHGLSMVRLLDTLSGPPADRLRLDYDARLVRRKRLVTEGGRDVRLDLAKPVDLGTVAGIALDDGTEIAVEPADEPVLRVTGDLPRLAWHIGNRHTPCEMGEGVLVIRDDAVLRGMLEGLGARIQPLRAPFRPEGGAYGHGRVMAHSHGSDSAHDEAHGHDHSHD